MTPEHKQAIDALREWRLRDTREALALSVSYLGHNVHAMLSVNGPSLGTKLGQALAHADYVLARQEREGA